jgi:hypothetical protein
MTDFLFCEGPEGLTERWAWVRRSIPEIEKATLRVVAIRISRTMAEAADRLGMAAVSLARWLARRSLDPVTGEPAHVPEPRSAVRVLSRCGGDAIGSRRGGVASMR